MSKKNILFLHGKESRPGGAKVKILEALGYNVINPLLSNDFDADADKVTEICDTHNIDLVVGSSRGGALAMALYLDSVVGLPENLVLLAPAWKKYLNHQVTPSDITEMNLNISVLHAKDDEVVPFRDSEEIFEDWLTIGCSQVSGHRLSDPLALYCLVGMAVWWLEKQYEG